MKSISYSNKGKRATNQDLILEYETVDGSYLFAVIDGMGGYENGEIAAKMVSENIETYLSSVGSIDTFHIQKAINKSNLAIRQQQSALSTNMGATIGGVIIKDSSVIYFWVGDVKVIHFRNNKLLFESTSHNLVNDLVQNGTLQELSQLSKYKHVVTRSIQGDLKTSKVEIESNIFYGNTDLLIVCSDGVHDLFASLQIENLLNKAESPLMLKAELEARLLRDASDNFTFGIITSN